MAGGALNLLIGASTGKSKIGVSPSLSFCKIMAPQNSPSSFFSNCKI